MLPVDEFGLLRAVHEGAAVTPDTLDIGKEYAPFDTFRLKPTETLTFHSNGQPGATISFELVRVPNTGGHYHGGESKDPLAVGTLVPSSVTLNGPYPQNIPNIFTAPEVCGSIRLIARFSTGEVFEHLAEVMFDSFLPIPQSTGIRLKPPESIHPSPYWADPAFITALKLLGERYSNVTKKDITITDASLLWGGRFDIQANDPKHEWLPPHAEHRNGRQADIRLRDMNESDRKVFLKICGELGLTAEIHAGNHFHIRLPLTPS